MRASWCRALPAFVRLEYDGLLLLQLHVRICNLSNHTQSCLSRTAARTFPNISLLASMPVLTLGVPPPLLFFLSKSSDPSAPRYFNFLKYLFIFGCIRPLFWHHGPLFQHVDLSVCTWALHGDVWVSLYLWYASCRACRLSSCGVKA